MPKLPFIEPGFYERPFMRLLKEFSPFRWTVGIILVLGLVVSLIQPLSVKLSQQIIDSLKGGLKPDFFRWVPATLIPLFIVNGFAKYFYNTIRRYLTEKVILSLRVRLFDKYVHFPLRVLDEKRTGEMLSKLQNDLMQMNAGIDTFCSVLKDPFTFIGLLGMAFYFDWQLAAMTLVVAPLVVALFSRSGAAVKRYSSRNLQQFSDLLSMSEEAIVGARVVKVFRLENVLLDKFKKIQDAYFHTAIKSIRVQELSTPAVEFVGSIILVLVFLYGGYRISAGSISLGDLLAFILTMGLSQMPIKQLNNAYLKLKIAEAASERVYSVLDTDEVYRYSLGRRRAYSFEDSIVYENVGLNYGPNEALRDVNFTVKRGQRVAFVGHSGSGKSSLINCLPRLYEVSSGAIRLDGADIRDIFIEDLRGLISFVTQDVFLFHDTIYENIRYGNPYATREEIERAANFAHCTEFISKMARGFDTIIGDRGVCLSGGERQRVAIARAFLKQAPLLILDEATSNLDSHSEAIVQETLETLMQGRTTFIVAHRFSTVRRADTIFVMDKGRIQETGSHDQLLKSDGLYQRLFEKQQYSTV